jgi:2-methylcitrate dehydratase PrpD
MAAADPSHALAAGSAALEPRALPQATLAAARRLVADSLAVALAGRGLADVEAVLKLARHWGGRAESSIIGAPGLRVPAPLAALVNGTMIQALDFDETHDPSAAHLASTVLAAALAVADQRGRSGRELLAALVAGVEVAARIGLACSDKIGWTGTAVYGTFGAAAAAAHLLGLDAAQTRHAFGIAISQAAGTTQTAVDSPLSKHIQSGFAAKAGVLSALLAAQGVSGVEGVFEGQFGFFRLYKGGRASAEPLLAPWRAPFEVERLSYKPFPSCRATHGPIQASLHLKNEIAMENIREIDVALPQLGWNLTGKPFEEGRNPMIAAQFSTAYTVATALVDGAVSLRHFTLEAIRDRRVRDLAARVRVHVEPGAEFTPARVDVHMAGGRTLSREVRQLKGSPELPMSDEEMLRKMADCLAFAPSGAAAIDAEELWGRVQAIDTLDSPLLEAVTAEFTKTT